MEQDGVGEDRRVAPDHDGGAIDRLVAPIDVAAVDAVCRVDDGDALGEADEVLDLHELLAVQEHAVADRQAVTESNRPRRA